MILKVAVTASQLAALCEFIEGQDNAWDERYEQCLFRKKTFVSTKGDVKTLGHTSVHGSLIFSITLEICDSYERDVPSLTPRTTRTPLSILLKLLSKLECFPADKSAAEMIKHQLEATEKK